jgi:dTMP kinase
LKARGVFITLEGLDGTGKSTHLRLLVQHLRRRGLRLRVTREPGGTRVGEKVRAIVLGSDTSKLAPLAELTLVYAARAQHLQEVVRPALARGEIVLSDRFNDASMAYQGYGRRLGTATVRALDRIICEPTRPDLTLVLDLSPVAALQRARRRERRRKSRRGRFEAQGLEFYRRVRAGYRAIARREPHRLRFIRSDRPVQEVQAEVRRRVDELLKSRGRRGSGA